jgi:lysophospholipase L1-like esterase
MKGPIFYLLLCYLVFSYPFNSCTKATPGSTTNYINNPYSNPPVNNIDTGKLITYLALGDSYTIGQSVDPTLRFPAQTAALLKQKGLNIQPPQYIATTGWTTLNLQAAIQSTKPQGPFDLVSLLIGVNDQYQGLDTTGYRPRFTQLLEKSIQLAGNKANHVFVLSIPDYSVTPYAAGSNREEISKEIDAFNAINKQVTLQYNCTYLDITPSTREAISNPALIAGDGLHPSGAEYKKWAERLEAVMLAAL